MPFLQRIYNLVWGAPALVLIVSLGLCLTLCTGFAQIRLLPRSCLAFLRRMVGKGQAGDGVSSFQAVCTALAATVGTGNLAGVAGALAIGGPGAIFWMWLCGILGMILKCAEATLAIHFRQKNQTGEYVGGPMYVIRNGLPKWLWPLAGIYAFFGLIASFGVGNATQINTVISAVESTAASYGLWLSQGQKLALGMVLAVLIGLALLGGAKRIGATTELLVPFAAGIYMLLGIFVLCLRWDQIPQAFAAIVHGAMAPSAVTGGMVGSFVVCLRTGMSRGVFTNEAGMGTAAIAHAGAQVRHPVEQGMMGIVEVFLDTIVICTVTALVILCSGIGVPYGTDAGIALTNDAFSLVLGPWVGVVIALSLCLFAIATVLGWGLYGIRCAQYLFGEGAWKWFAVLQIVTVLFGAMVKGQTLWLLAEILNGLMVIPNLIALWVLMPTFMKLYKSYLHGGTYENFHQCKPL